MAEPTIVINASTGSDIAASGSPSGITALSGTGAKTTSGSGVIDLSADAPNLTTVPVDGTGAIWVDTPSGRKFFKITSKDDTADTVTSPQTADVTFSNMRWGIGGKRASYRQEVTDDVLANWVVTIEVPSAPPPVTDLTGSDMITLMRDWLDDPSSSPNIPRWSNDQMLRAINDAQEFICQEYKLIREQISLATSNDVREYNISARILSIENISKSDYTKTLNHTSKTVLDSIWDNWRNLNSEPDDWYWEDSKQIGLKPMPDGVYNYVIDAWVLPQTNITLSGLPAIHRRHQMGIAYRAAWELGTSDTGNDFRIAMAVGFHQKFLDIMRGVPKFKLGGRSIVSSPPDYRSYEKPLPKFTS